jgi:ribonuclease HII
MQYFGLISKDLGSSGFFEGFTIVLPSVVRKECDTRGGKAELERLAQYASIRKIEIVNEEEIGDEQEHSSSLEKDKKIVNTALKYNAILLTRDKSMKASSVSKNVFTIWI